MMAGDKMKKKELLSKLEMPKGEEDDMLMMEDEEMLDMSPAPKMEDEEASAGLEMVSDDELMAEMKKRGLSVEMEDEEEMA